MEINPLDKVESLLFNLMKKREQERVEFELQNPSNAPNEVLNHAIISNCAITNDEMFKPIEYNHLMDIGYEKIFVWTYEEDTDARLVSKVDLLVAKENLWKTAAEILNLTIALGSGLERITDMSYRWIYRFD